MNLIQEPQYFIVPSGDYFHVTCAECGEACIFDFKGRDPIMVLIEITCPNHGSSGKWKLHKGGEGFPSEPYEAKEG